MSASAEAQLPQHEGDISATQVASAEHAPADSPLVDGLQRYLAGNDTSLAELALAGQGVAANLISGFAHAGITNLNVQRALYHMPPLRTIPKALAAQCYDRMYTTFQEAPLQREPILNSNVRYATEWERWFPQVPFARQLGAELGGIGSPLQERIREVIAGYGIAIRTLSKPKHP